MSYLNRKSDTAGKKLTKLRINQDILLNLRKRKIFKIIKRASEIRNTISSGTYVQLERRDETEKCLINNQNFPKFHEICKLTYPKSPANSK